MTRRRADTDAENKALRQQIKNLLSRIYLNNKVRFSSTSQKGIKKNAAPVQDKEIDKDEFDGNNGIAISTVSQAEPLSEEPVENPKEFTRIARV